jgi:hypothetical protein
MESKFTKKAREAVLAYVTERQDTTDTNRITYDDVFVVWFCKTLQNWKAMLSTTISDGMYYEATYNGDSGELYLDAYKKWENVVIHDA